MEPTRIQVPVDVSETGWTQLYAKSRFDLKMALCAFRTECGSYWLHAVGQLIDGAVLKLLCVLIYLLPKPSAVLKLRCRISETAPSINQPTVIGEMV
jgi:hypothetical protein